MRRTAVLALAGLLSGTGLTALAPAASAADSVVPLPLTAYRDIVVDDAHSHLFLTGGGSNGVVVRDLAGAAVTTITNQPGASQMTLSEDGSLLYVALASGDAVSAISTTTLTEVTRYSTGATTCPASVAVTMGKVWFGYGCGGASGNLGVIDPAAVDPDPVVTLGTLTAGSYYYAPRLQASAAKPGLLVAGEFGISPATLRVLDVSTGAAVVSATNHPGSNLQDFAITSDGSHVITASGSPYEHDSYKTTDLSADGVYGSNNPYPNAVATGAGGPVAAGLDASYSTDISIYQAAGTLVRSYEMGGCCNQGQSGSLADAGLALNADASVLYAVTTDYLGAAVTLRVLRDPGKLISTLDLYPPVSVPINHAFAISGTLTSAGLPVAGALVTVARDSTYGTVPLAPRTTASDGSFSIPDTLSRRGVYGYTVSWAGDSSHAGTTSRRVTKVIGLTPALSITTSAGPYAYGAKPVVVAHLGTTKVRTLSIYAQPYGGTKVRLKTGTVDANGNLGVAYTLSRRTTFTASFAGDDTYEPRAVAKALTVHARVAETLYGAYGTSSGYKLFHTSVDPTLVVTVAANNAGSCVSYVAQYYSSGAWHTGATLSCGTLDANSQHGAVYYTNAPAGTRFRMRAAFSGSALNVATTGAWVYGKFTT